MRLKDYPKSAAPASGGCLAIGLLHMYLDAPGHQIGAFMLAGVALGFTALMVAIITADEKDED